MRSAGALRTVLEDLLLSYISEDLHTIGKLTQYVPQSFVLAYTVVN